MSQRVPTHVPERPKEPGSGVTCSPPFDDASIHDAIMFVQGAIGHVIDMSREHDRNEREASAMTALQDLRNAELMLNGVLQDLAATERRRDG